MGLRMKMIQGELTHDYLNNLHCNTEMFDSIQQMSKANYPEIEI